jgi:hypothetical protein
MKILLGDFNAKVGRENIFKPTTGNKIIHKDSNYNGVRITNSSTSKNLVVKSTMFLHRNIYKYTCTFTSGKTYNQNNILTDTRHRVSSMYDLSGKLTVILITV